MLAVAAIASEWIVESRPNNGAAAIHHPAPLYSRVEHASGHPRAHA